MPVLVEGPTDAIAVNLADGDRYGGLASLGTALTDYQAVLLADRRIDPILASDPDPAGTAAAERAFWTLTAANLARQSVLPPASDPADLKPLLSDGAASLCTLLEQADPLAEKLTGSTLQTASSPSSSTTCCASPRPNHPIPGLRRSTPSPSSTPPDCASDSYRISTPTPEDSERSLTRFPGHLF